MKIRNFWVRLTLNTFFFVDYCPLLTIALGFVKRPLTSLVLCSPLQLLLFSYSAINGVYSGWDAFLLPNLDNFRPRDRAETEAGWLGFYATVAGCVAGVIMSKIADKYSGRLKRLLLVSFSVNLVNEMSISTKCFLYNPCPPCL